MILTIEIHDFRSETNLYGWLADFRKSNPMQKGITICDLWETLKAVAAKPGWLMIDEIQIGHTIQYNLKQ